MAPKEDIVRKSHLWMIAIFLWILLAAEIYVYLNKPEDTSFTIYMTEYTFVPDEIAVPAGAQIKLTLVNRGKFSHEVAFMLSGNQASPPFTLADEVNVTWEHEMSPAASQTVTFQTPTEPGEYQMVCGLPGHLEQGMQGTLVVQ